MSKKTGRPSKLTPEITERFINAIQLGATYELASKYAGIAYQTLQNWRDKKEPEFVAFFEDVLQAEGKAAIQWLAVLEKHSKADGKWAAWKLERRYPHEYGRIVQEVVGKDGTPLLQPVADALTKIYGSSGTRTK